MKTTCYLGIDPGKSGAICLLHGEGVLIKDTPVMHDGDKNQYDIKEMIEIVKLFRTIGGGWPTAIIEQVNAMPGQGVTSMFSMGYGLGLWHSILACHGVPFVRVRPQEWKKSFGLKGKDKGASILRAQELYPQADIRLKKHHDRAEALLMAEFLRRKNLGFPPTDL